MRDRTLVVVLLNIPFQSREEGNILPIYNIPFFLTRNQQVKVYWVRTEFVVVPFEGNQN